MNSEVLTRFYEELAREVSSLDVREIIAGLEENDLLIGIPDDFISLLLPEGSKNLTEVVSGFYAPLPISLLIVKKGMDTGVFRLEGNSLLLTTKVGKSPLSAMLTVEKEKDSPCRWQAEAIASLMRETDVLLTEERPLFILNLSTPFTLKAKSDRVVIHGIPEKANPLFVRGVPFGVHDCIIADVIPGFEEAICDAVSANLRPYGSALISYAPFLYGQEGYPPTDLFTTMENCGLFATDMIRKGGAFAVRAVKYPELPELIRREEQGLSHTLK